MARLRRFFVLAICAVGLGVAGWLELVNGPVRFWMNRGDIDLFRAQFPNAEYFGRNVGINGLTAQRPVPGQPSYLFEADLDLAYRPSRTVLTIELIQQVDRTALAVRNELTFSGSLKDEVLHGAIDRRLFDKYPSLYPAASPLPMQQ